MFSLRLCNNKSQSSCTVILQALKRNSNLKMLNLNDNNMTGKVVYDLADVIANNTSLEGLYLRGNNLQSSVNVILQAIKGVSNVKVLDLSDNNMSEEVASDLADVIKNPTVKQIWLSGNLLKNGLLDIVKKCRNFQNLKVLELSRSSCNSTMVANLASVTGSITTLEALFFGGITLSNDKYFYVCYIDGLQNSSGSETFCNNSEKLEIVSLEMQKYLFHYYMKFSFSWPYRPFCTFVTIYKFLHVIDQCLKLSSISLSIVKLLHRNLSQMDSTLMAQALVPVIKKLKVLDLEYSNIGEYAAAELAIALFYNDALEQLWLRGNVLCDDGAAVILNSLQNLKTLLILDLSYNNISIESSDAIAAVINSNNSLEQLWLDGNCLLNNGVVRIADALQGHSRLKLLSLCSTGITEHVAEEISAVIKSNSGLEYLMLGGNQLQSLGVSRLSKVLCGKENLRNLNFFSNRITKESAFELANVISHCTNLEELYLGNNMLETSGALEILEAVKTICTLRVLTLSNNNITKEAASSICDVIAIHYSLSILLLGGNDLQTDGVVQIAEAVRHNEAVQLFAVFDNNVDEQTKEDIKLLFSDRPDLHLYI